MVRLKDYFEAIYNAVSPLVDKVYLNDRPKASSDKLGSYIVIDVVSPSNREMSMDGSFDYFNATAYLSLFVRDKVNSKALGQMNIKELDRLTKAVWNIFPIVDDKLNVKVYKPYVVIPNGDDSGYHYILIQARLTTYF